MDVRHNNNALQESNDFIGGLLHLGLNVITFRTLLHLGPNVITFRTLLHLGQLLHLGLQHRPSSETYVNFGFLLLLDCAIRFRKGSVGFRRDNSIEVAVIDHRPQRYLFKTCFEPL